MTRRLIALSILCVACKAEPEAEEELPFESEHIFSEHGMLQMEHYTSRTDETGRISVQIQVDSDTTAFMVAATGPDQRVAIEALYDPNGELVYWWEDWYETGHELTAAAYENRYTNGLNWPIRPEDGPLIEGTYEAVVGTYYRDPRQLAPDNDIELSILTKSDPDFGLGTLRVHVVLADQMDTNPDVLTTVNEALAYWGFLWVPLGLQIDVVHHTSDLDNMLGFVDNGGDEVTALSDEIAEPGDLILIIGDRIGTRPWVYGTAANTPGVPLSSKYHFVAIAYGALAGDNGVFDNHEIDTMGAVMAHETSHYMGLPHVVNMAWDTFDAIADTPECDGETECRDLLDGNMMFPYCDDATCKYGTYTPDQIAVLHRYIGTL